MIVSRLTEYVATTMSHNLLDHTLLLEILQCRPCQRSVDLESVDQHGDGDEAIGLHILLQLLGGGLVEHDGVVGLVLDLALGPLLLLLLRSGCCGRLRNSHIRY